MKILYIRNASVQDFGGAERLVVHFGKEALLNGLDTLVVSRQKSLLKYAAAQNVPYKKGWWWSRQNWSGKKVIFVPIYLFWQFMLLCWYIQLIFRTRPTTVHLMSKDDFIAGTLAAKMFRKTIIWTDPADLKHIYKNHRIWYKNPIGKIVYFCSRFASVVTLVSESERKLIEISLEGKAPSNHIVLHVAGKDETAEPVARGKNAVVFCSTSRLVIAKGIRELIAAFNHSDIVNTNFELWLVGDGPDKTQFVREATGNSHIKFLGQTNQPLKYVAACDVFVQPTHHEGFSLSLAEAAMLGKPMIASNVGGNPELVNKKNGLLFEVQNIKDLVAAILELGKNKQQRERLGLQARKDYKQFFDFSVIYRQKFMKLYK